MPTKIKKQKGRPAEIDPDRLLDVSITLFAERGFDGTTTREIARRADCNVAMISYHFGSKNGLYQAVLARHFKHIRNRFIESNAAEAHDNVELARAWPELESPEERRLAASLHVVAELIISDDRMHKILTREIMSGGKNVAALARHGDFSVVVPIMQSLQKLVDEKKLSRKLDPKLTAISLIGPIVYSNIACPIIKTAIGLDTDASYRRRLCLHLVSTLFHGSGH